MGLRLSPTCYRSVLVRFSLGPRSSLVRLSFVSRSLFVSLSNTERGPNEEQAKNERKSNEYRSRCRRETIGNSTICDRHGWQNALLQPQTNILPLTLLLPRQIAALSAPPRTFSQQIKPFPPILHTTKTPSQALKTPRRHTAQQPPKTHPTSPKHPLTSTQTQPFTASIVGQTPRFRKVKRAELSALEPSHDEKGAIK